MAHRTFNHRNDQPQEGPRISPVPVPGVRPPAKLRTIEETAELFNTSTRTVRQLIDAGALPVHRLGRCVRISDLDIVVFLAANRSI